MRPHYAYAITYGSSDLDAADTLRDARAKRSHLAHSHGIRPGRLNITQTVRDAETGRVIVRRSL